MVSGPHDIIEVDPQVVAIFMKKLLNSHPNIRGKKIEYYTTTYNERKKVYCIIFGFKEMKDFQLFKNDEPNIHGRIELGVSGEILMRLEREANRAIQEGDLDKFEMKFIPKKKKIIK